MGLSTGFEMLFQGYSGKVFPVCIPSVENSLAEVCLHSRSHFDKNYLFITIPSIAILLGHFIQIIIVQSLLKNFIFIFKNQFLY